MLVAFGGKERYVGEAAVPLVRSNYSNTVTQIKRLIGRKFSEPEVQHEIENFLGYRVLQLADDEIGIEVRAVFACLAESTQDVGCLVCPAMFVLLSMLARVCVYVCACAHECVYTCVPLCVCVLARACTPVCALLRTGGHIHAFPMFMLCAARVQRQH